LAGFDLHAAEKGRDLTSPVLTARRAARIRRNSHLHTQLHSKKELRMSEEFTDDLDTPSEADLESCYGSKYFSAVDLGDKKIRTRIGKVRKEIMTQQGGKSERTKFVLYFTTVDKPMVLNATNKNALVDKLGKVPGNWIDAEVGLFTAPTQFQGKPMKGLRLTVLSAPKKAATAPKLTAEPPPDDTDDPGPAPDDYGEAAE
jgi:hypothetical protein